MGESKGASVIDFPAVGNFYNQDDQCLILKFANDPIIPDAIPPETRQITCQGFSDAARIWRTQNALFKIIDDPLLNRAIKFKQLLAGRLFPFNLPQGQVLS